MKQIHLLLAAGSAALFIGAGVATPALADCDVAVKPFFMHKSDHTAHTLVTDSRGCQLNFVTDEKTKFRNASIVRGASHGKLVKTAKLEFVYHPRPGFMGNDQFALRVCGSSPAGRGCSTLDYTATTK